MSSDTASRAHGGFRPLSLAGLALTAILLGGLLGAATNAVSGKISALYFVNVLGWEDVSDVWRAAIAQGVLEGLLWGVFFALVFTTVVGIVTRGSCPYLLGATFLAGMVGGVLVGWLLGGLIAVGLAALSPEFYRETFYPMPENPAEMRRYAFVGGAIWGEMLGGVVAVTLGCVLFAVRWKRRTPASEGAALSAPPFGFRPEPDQPQGETRENSG